MRPFFKSTKGKLLILLAVMMIFGACIIGGGNNANQSNSGGDAVNPAPPVDQPENNQPAPVEPEPPAEEPPAEEPPAEEPPAEEPPAEEPPAEEPPAADEELNTTRLVPALKNIMLRPEDLKEEYIMQNDKEVDNTRMISQITWGDGRVYNAATSRITGWNTYMERAQNIFAPFSFRTRVEVFETVEGAKTAFSDDWLFIYNDENLDLSEILSTDCDYGQECVLAYYEENIAGTTDFNVYYHLVFRYHNVTVYVFSRGLEGTVDEDTVYEIADLMISRLSEYE